MKSKRRALQFEHLESKTSPTATLVDVVWSPEASEGESVIEQRSASSFSKYVALMLEEIHLDRTLPSTQDVAAADHLLTTEFPDMGS